MMVHEHEPSREESPWQIMAHFLQDITCDSGSRPTKVDDDVFLPPASLMLGKFAMEAMCMAVSNRKYSSAVFGVPFVNFTGCVRNLF